VDRSKRRGEFEVSYDQWKTASPYDNDVDVVEEAEKCIKSVDYALINWETKPGPWQHHIDAMKQTIEDLLGFINENI
jgi:hypothetical protein